MDLEFPLQRTRPGRDDAGAWEDFVGRYRRPLVAAVRRALARKVGRPQPEIVEEAVQEVYRRLLEQGVRPARFRGRDEREVTTYLARVAHSVVVDLVRTTLAAKRGGLFRRSWEADALEAVADPAPSPEERFLGREGRRLFIRRCREVAGGGAGSRRNLRIALLAIVGGWTSPEIAVALGGCLTPSTIDTILHRLRLRLAQGGVLVPHR
jgi:DNA-directed RNA polymerase specialized sigma24 family protein